MPPNPPPIPGPKMSLEGIEKMSLTRPHCRKSWAGPLHALVAEAVIAGPLLVVGEDLVGLGGIRGTSRSASGSPPLRSGWNFIASRRYDFLMTSVPDAERSTLRTS